MSTEASRPWRTRLRWAVRIYLILLGLAVLILFLAAANSGRTVVVSSEGGTTSTSVVSSESLIGGVDPFTLANWIGGVFVVLVLMGTVFAIVVSFLKRHSVAAVAGLLILGLGISVSIETARNPEAGIVWATLGPLLLLLLVALPVVGAARRAKLGSRWATYFDANDPGSEHLARTGAKRAAGRGWLMTLLALVGAVFLIVGIDRVVGLGQDAAWRHQARPVTGVIVRYNEIDSRFESAICGGPCPPAAVVQIEDDGVIYESLMDGSVGEIGQSLDLIYLPYDPPLYQPYSDYPIVRLLPRPSLGPVIVSGLGFLAVGVGILWLGWRVRKRSAPEK